MQLLFFFVSVHFVLHCWELLFLNEQLSFGPGRNPPHSLTFLIHSALFHPTNTSLCLRLSSVRLREGGRRGENESLAGGFPNRRWDMWEEPHSLPILTYYFLSLPATKCVFL